MDSGVLGSLPVVQFDADGRIADDVPCEQCYYNLRGLSAESVCPECGYATAESVERTCQRLAQDMMWHRMTADGLRGLSCGLAIGVCLLMFSPSEPPRSGTLLWLIVEVLAPAAACTGLLFGLLVTCQRSPRPDRSALNRLQLGVRALLAISLAGCVLDAGWTLSLLIAAASLHAIYLIGTIAAVKGARLRALTAMLGWGFIVAGIAMILNDWAMIPANVISPSDFHAGMKGLYLALGSGFAVTAWINSRQFRAYGGGHAIGVR